jgi:methylmalonyl-CoA mutase cobalamin-binding subunit
MRAERSTAIVANTGAVERLLVIINRNAGGVRRQPQLLFQLTEAVGSRGEVVATGDAADLEAAVTRARARGVDTIGICGGDGSNLHTLTAIARVYRGAAWPRIALLPGGTLNTGASHFQARGSAPDRLHRIVEADRPLAVSTPLIRVNEHVGLIFGSLMVARVLDTYYDGYTSPVGAVVLASRIVSSAALQTPFSRDLFHSEPVEIELDGKSHGHVPLTALLASVVACPAVGMRVLYRAGEDGCFHIIGTNAQPAAIFREVGRVWSGLPVKAMCLDALAKEAIFRFERPARYTMDGDLFSADEIRITATAPVEVLLPPLE